MPNRELTDATPAEVPTHEDVQQLIEAESGRGTQGIQRVWQASNSAKVVLTSDANGVRISADDGTTTPSQVLVASMLDALIPPGTIWAYGGPTAPAGWLLCDGTAYATATYPKLAAALGYAYGGAGATFSVPNLAGRVVLGVGGTHARGQISGAETAPGPAHAHGLGATHTHGMTNHDHTMNGHSHQTNIDHGHGASSAGGSGASDTFNVVSPGIRMVRDTHNHAITVDVLGAAYYDSLGPTAPNTNTSGATNYTGGTATSGTASANDTATANYGGVTVPTMMPFGVANWIIRTGN